jgi:superfamily II helicase
LPDFRTHKKLANFFGGGFDQASRLVHSAIRKNRVNSVSPTTAKTSAAVNFPASHASLNSLSMAEATAGEL